jgi:hypothetical protein
MHRPALMDREAYPKNNKPPLDVQRAGLPGSSGGVKVAPFLASLPSPLWTAGNLEAGSVPIRNDREFGGNDGERSWLPSRPGAILGGCDISAQYLGSYLIRPMRNALATAWVRLTVSSFLVARLR